MASAEDYDRLMSELADLPENGREGLRGRAVSGGVVEIGRQTQGLRTFDGIPIGLTYLHNL